MCTPPPLSAEGGGGLNLQTKFQKGGLDRISTFRGGGLGLFADLRGAWQERGGGVFEGGGGVETPMHTMEGQCLSNFGCKIGSRSQNICFVVCLALSQQTNLYILFTY